MKLGYLVEKIDELNELKRKSISRPWSKEERQQANTLANINVLTYDLTEESKKSFEQRESEFRNAEYNRIINEAERDIK